MYARRELLLVAVLGFATRLSAQSDRAENLQNPFAGVAAALAAGKVIFSASCQSCHSANGSASSFASGTFQRGGADGEIFLNIRNGIRNTAMAPYARLSTDQIWQVVTYLRSLAVAGSVAGAVTGAVTGPSVAPPASAAAAVLAAVVAPGDPANGELIFAGKGACLSCHQFNGKGVAVGPDLTSSALTAAQ